MILINVIVVLLKKKGVLSWNVWHLFDVVREGKRHCVLKMVEDLM